MFDSVRSTSSYLQCQVWNSGQQCCESVIRPDTKKFFNINSYTSEKQCMPGDSMAFQSNNSATHGGFFNTNTSCNFTVHPALGCQVSNSCYNTTGLSGLGDSVDTLGGIHNTYYALVRELDNSDALRGNFCYDEKQYDGQLHEPHGSIDSFSISIDTVDLSTFSLLSCKAGGSQHITPQDVSKLMCTYVCTEQEVVSGYTPNNMESRGKSNAPTLLTREFGFMPLQVARDNIPLQVNKLECTDKNMWVQKLHAQVKKFGLPNYKGARIPVPSGLNIPAWWQVLKNYDISKLFQYLQFGFPLGVDYSLFEFKSFTKNHSSAVKNPMAVEKYFNTEVSKKAMFGPYHLNPFEKMHFSPLMARPKPDGGTRIIVDLSWPVGASVNSCVPSNVYDDVPFILKYPTIDQVVERINLVGPSALLYKVDLERAFRNLQVDPFDYPLLGLQWNTDVYVDVSVPFGLKFGAAACQMCTDALTLTLRSQKLWLINYLDDYVGVAPPGLANSHFLSLMNLL